MKDTNKVVLAVKYGGAVAGANAVAVTNEDVRLAPVPTSGSFKELNGKIGNKIVWKNDDDTVVEGANADGFLLGNDATGTALDTPPYWTEIYKLCGLTETIDSGVGTESVTYTPSQTQPSDASEVAIWRDGAKRVLSGAIGSVTITGKVGEPITQSVSLYGFTTLASATEANPTAPATDKSLLIVHKSTDTITFTGTPYKGVDFTLTQGNDIQKLYALGVKTFDLSDFESSLEVTYLKDNDNIYTDFANGTVHSVVITAGSANGKKIQITAGQAEVESVTESSVNGKEAIKVKFMLNGDANGENQYSMKFGTIA